LAEYLKKRRSAAPTASVDESVRQTVADIIADVEARGEPAVREYSRRFDQWDPPSFQVTEEQVEQARRSLPQTLIEDIHFAQAQVRRFAERQRESLENFEIETMPGVVLGQRQIPVSHVGAYIPGGRYKLIASAFMSILTAKAAGVANVIACAPPAGEEGIHPATLYAMSSSGADRIFCIGGVQALAAMAFGAVDGMQPVHLLVGPGNRYVAEAKRQLFGRVGIDLIAGPTEILIIADDTADPYLVALDLLAQAEHGPDSPAVLIALSRKLAEAVLQQIPRCLDELPTRDIAAAAWEDFGEIAVVSTPEEAARLADEYAPEHLEVHVADPDWYLDHLRNYGTLFLGSEATVAYSDKAIGTNHILPTARAARYTGGLWVGKFVKTVTYQRVTKEGSRAVAPRAATICRAEGMIGHAMSAEVRLKDAAKAEPDAAV